MGVANRIKLRVARKLELKADVPERQRVERGHKQAGGEQRDERQAAAVQVVRQGHQQAHDGGAHHGGVGADEQGVEDDPCHDRIERPALADHPAKGGRHDASDDRYVKSRDYVTNTMTYRLCWSCDCLQCPSISIGAPNGRLLRYT